MQEKTYKKIISFGKVKIDKNRTYATNEITLELTLKVKNNKTIFTVSGNLWESNHSDSIIGGQCVDSLWNEYATQIEEPTLYKQILGLWQRNHLNDLHPDCEHQRKWKWSSLLIDNSKPYSQDNARGWLPYKLGGIGLLSKPCPECGYKYGSAWIYEPIDKQDLRSICKIMKIDIQEAVQISKLGKE